MPFEQFLEATITAVALFGEPARPQLEASPSRPAVFAEPSVRSLVGTSEQGLAAVLVGGFETDETWLGTGSVVPTLAFQGARSGRLDAHGEQLVRTFAPVLDWSGMTTLSFWVYRTASAGADLDLAISISDSLLNTAYAYYASFATDATQNGVWVRYDLPLSIMINIGSVDLSQIEIISFEVGVTGTASVNLDNVLVY